MRKLYYAIAAISVALPAAQAAFLSAGTSSTGLQGSTQTVTSGDKVFSNFSCSLSGPFGNAIPTDCGQIQVNSSTDTAGNLGVLFSTGFNAITPPPNSFVDVLLNYTVTAPAALITDLHMTFNGNVTGTGSTNVTETVTAPGGGTVGQITVQNPPPNLEAATNLTGGPYTTLNVRKDILVSSGSGPGTANFSFVGQYFSQVVPEPASVALFGTILAGAALLRRKSKSA